MQDSCKVTERRADSFNLLILPRKAASVRSVSMRATISARMSLARPVLVVPKPTIVEQSISAPSMLLRTRSRSNTGHVHTH